MANDFRMQALNEPTGGTYSDIAGSHLRQKDEHTLARLGKQQVLKVSADMKRQNNEILKAYKLSRDDSAFCRCSASAAPYWRLGRLPWRWLTSLAWVAVLATESIFVGTIIQGLIILNKPSYEKQAWHGTMLCWAVITVAVFINTVVSGLLPIIEGLILVFHVLGFVAVLIPLLYLSPHGSAASVFQTSLNEGGWPTQGISYCVGFIGNVATFVGKFVTRSHSDRHMLIPHQVQMLRSM
ncbi:MAG: hypothetical protein Q9200_006497 [Gallowayella weberi]